MTLVRGQPRQGRIAPTMGYPRASPPVARATCGGPHAEERRKARAREHVGGRDRRGNSRGPKSPTRFRMRVVVDTNVLVSAMLSPHAPPAQGLRLVLQGDLVPLHDERIISEYRQGPGGAAVGFGLHERGGG